MATFRKITFKDGFYYHVYNRGVEKRPTFIGKRAFGRAIIAIKYYRFTNPPFKLSKFLKLTKDQQIRVQSELAEKELLVEVVAYCLMPNHFHFLLKQLQPNGITKFLSNFTNSYTKYFNTRNQRVGPLFQGTFKAVLVEDDEQLLHLSRYIHLNPVASAVIAEKDLEDYESSSYLEYLGKNSDPFCSKDIVRGFFSSTKKFKQFTTDQINYAQELEKIKHLALE